MMDYAFRKKYDVVVAGAGVAGVAAAVAAARRGRRVALIEKQTLIGGLATSGLIFVYLPLCDGFGTQVISGISEEFLRKSVEFSPFDLNKKWGGESSRSHRADNRFEVDFSPAGFTLTLDDFLVQAGVELWLDTLVCSVQTEGKRITALEVENITGRGIVEADAFVDATGSALLVQRAGGKVIHDINHHSFWFMEMSPDASQYHLSGSLHIKAMVGKTPDFTGEDSYNGKKVTEYTRLTWKNMREYYRTGYQAGRFSHADFFPVHLPAMAQFRKIAGIAGKTMLNTGDNQKRYEDSIGMTGDWRKPGPVWETPFGALVPEEIDGVFAAGRCIASAGDAWEVYRVIPTAAMTGEAAGIAAAIASEKGIAASCVRAIEVQSALKEKGVKLHLDEAGLPYGEIKAWKGEERTE